MAAGRHICYLITRTDTANMQTPTEFVYHDVLHMLRCTTWSEENPKLASSIQNHWECHVGCEEIAEHIIYHGVSKQLKPKESMTDLSWSEVPSSSQKDIVRLKQDKDLPIEIYSHKRDDQALEHY